MKKKKARLQMIKDIIRENVVGCQDELAKLLAVEGMHVTQATLSRDLKALRITKVANHEGAYMYVMSDGYDQTAEGTVLPGGRMPGVATGFVSLEFSGNFAVIKTRNGYASGLAYDIDMAELDEFIGTIAGANTVFAVLREGITHRRASRALSTIIPEIGETL
ncbi:MAG: arginine repressor [Muribaculaceae bacterium]